jgi:AcrR family transcriptional regulator
MTPDAVKPRRRYDNRRRQEQARQARRRILHAAHGLFVDQGYPGTTMAAVAGAAGVSVETVYKAFGSKAALAKKVWDVTLVGDDEPVPLAQRPEFTAVTGDPDPHRMLAGYAAIGRVLLERLGPLQRVILEGAQAGDPELRELMATIDRERLAGATGFVAKLTERGALRQGLDPEAARDILWTLISPEVCRLLVDGRGWSLDRWERWLADTLAAVLLDPRPASQESLT